VHKLIEVEEATELMEGAKNWSIWRWLFNKSRVRTAADRAVDALSEAEKKVKASWSEDLKKAYRELEAQQAFQKNPRSKQRYEKAKEEAKHINPEIKLRVEKVKQADDEAETARLDAEDTFAEAERQLSASGARLGAEKAIHSWQLRRKAIRRAEALGKK
jgi:predicted  nucleic acid-binding Zn-ribbon protein